VLPSEERLARRRDFAAVYARKKSWAVPLLVLYLRRHEPNGPDAETRRFGFSVSKKVGKAHDRNRVKRRLREICRAHRGEWQKGFDAVFVARSAAQFAEYVALENAVCELLRRAQVIQGTRTAAKNAIGKNTTETEQEAAAQPNTDSRVFTNMVSLNGPLTEQKKPQRGSIGSVVGSIDSTDGIEDAAETANSIGTTAP
jgi:ribonuclease P protein component